VETIVEAVVMIEEVVMIVEAVETTVVEIELEAEIAIKKDKH
jgi:hypothetical protein